MAETETEEEIILKPPTYEFQEPSQGKFQIMGFSGLFTLAEVRKKIQQYASKYAMGLGKPETAIANARNAYRVYRAEASPQELQELHFYLSGKNAEFFQKVVNE